MWCVQQLLCSPTCPRVVCCVPVLSSLAWLKPLAVFRLHTGLPVLDHNALCAMCRSKATGKARYRRLPVMSVQVDCMCGMLHDKMQRHAALLGDVAAMPQLWHGATQLPCCTTVQYIVSTSFATNHCVMSERLCAASLWLAVAVSGIPSCSICWLVVQRLQYMQGSSS